MASVRRRQSDGLRQYAERILQDVLPYHRGTDSPDSLSCPGALYFCGLLAMRSHDYDVANAFFTRAAAMEPRNPKYVSALASSFSALGIANQALSACLHAVTLAPENPDLYAWLGRQLCMDRRLIEAVAMYRRALSLGKDDARTHVELGDVLRDRHMSDEALKHYEAARRLDSCCADAYSRIGYLMLSCQKWSLAERSFREGLLVDHTCAELHVGIGRVHLRQGDFERATEAFRAALAINPKDIGALRCLVCALELGGCRAETVGVWLCLGNALASQRRFEEAATAFREALARKHDCLAALVGLGRAYLSSGNPDQAIQPLEAVLALEPEHRLAHRELGHALQRIGEYERGCKESEGWSRPPHGGTWSDLEQPVWDGSPLEGRTILLWEAGALGDAIQFLRFVSLVKACGAGTVIVECHRRLVPLVGRMPDVDRVVARGAPLPPFDLHERLGRLSLVLGTRRTTIPACVPYLHVEENLREAWRQQLKPDGTLLVGLSWGGNLRNGSASQRFVRLRAFAALSDLTGVRFISLQLGPQMDELLTPLPGFYVESLQDNSSSLADAAALIKNLDLVITVDTMIAHLAGALGVPVWVLLPRVADARWQKDADDSPWYPTMRLFRQAKAGDWSNVFHRVRNALEQLVLARADTGSSSTPRSWRT